MDLCDFAQRHLAPRHWLLGMTPVIATVDGKTWKTTIWKDSKRKRTLLPVPKRIRGGKGDGDKVAVELRMDRERILGPAHPLE